MNNPKFYIFGVPDGFNLFQGESDEISYFQLFYDGSKENTKLTIHRKVNGQVSYVYLKYRLLSGEGRPGAFWGMSIVFNGEYCTDVQKLYRLFDSVYHEIILKGKILLEEINGNPNFQAKFLIHRFKEQEAEVKKIEGIVLKNIENKFAGEIHALDSSFNEAKQSFIRKINDRKNNAVILEALRTYSWVSISPEYPEENVEEISAEGKKALNDNGVTIKDMIIDYYSKILSKNIDEVRGDVERLESTVKENRKTIQKYIERQPEIIDLRQKYDEIHRQLDGLKTAVNKKSKKNDDNRPDDNKKKTGKENGTIDPKKSLNPVIKKNRFAGFKSNARKLKSLAIFLVVVGIVTLLWQIPWHKNSSNDCAECVTYLKNFESFLAQNEFEKAHTELNKVSEKGIDVSTNQRKLNEKAGGYFMGQSATDFNNSEDPNRDKIDLYYAAIARLDSAKPFGLEIIEQVKENYRKQTITYYEYEIDKSNNYDNKKAYANIIISLDGANSKAKDILSNPQSGKTQADRKPITKSPNGECWVKVDDKTNARKVSEIYNEFQSKLDKKQFGDVIKACDIIINNCAEEKVKLEAQKWKAKADSYRKAEPLNKI